MLGTAIDAAIRLAGGLIMAASIIVLLPLVGYLLISAEPWAFFAIGVAIFNLRQAADVMGRSEIRKFVIISITSIVILVANPEFGWF